MPAAITAPQLSNMISAISAARAQRSGSPDGVTNPDISTARPTYTPGLSQNALMRAGVEYLGNLGSFHLSGGGNFDPEPGTRLANHAAVLGAALKAADGLAPGAVGGRDSAEYKALEAAAVKLLKHSFSGATGDYDKTIEGSGKLANSLTQAEKALHQYVGKVGTQAFAEQVFAQVILPEAMQRIQANFPALFVAGRWAGDGGFDAKQFLQAEYTSGTLTVVAKALEQGGRSLVSGVLEAFKLPDYVLAPMAKDDPNASPTNGGKAPHDPALGADVAGRDRIAGSVHNAPVTVTVTGRDVQHTCESGAMKDAIAAVDRSNERMYAIIDKLIDGCLNLRLDFGGIDNVVQRSEVQTDRTSLQDGDAEVTGDHDADIGALMANFKDLGDYENETVDHRVRNGMNTGSFGSIGVHSEAQTEWTSVGQTADASVNALGMTDVDGGLLPAPEGFRDSRGQGMGATGTKAAQRFNETVAVSDVDTSRVMIDALKGDDGAVSIANWGGTTTRRDRGIDARISNMSPNNRPTSQERTIRNAFDADLKRALSGDALASLKKIERDGTTKDFRSVEQVRFQERVQAMAAKREGDAKSRDPVTVQLRDTNAGFDSETSQQRGDAIAMLGADRAAKQADLAASRAEFAFNLSPRNTEASVYGSDATERRGDNGSNSTRQSNSAPATSQIMAEQPAESVLGAAPQPPVRTPAAGSSVVGPQSNMLRRSSLEQTSVSPVSDSVRPPFGTPPTVPANAKSPSLIFAPSDSAVGASTSNHRSPLRATTLGNHEATAGAVGSLTAGVAEMASRLSGGALSSAVAPGPDASALPTGARIEVLSGQASAQSNASVVRATSSALNAPDRVSIQLTDTNVGIDEETTKQRMDAIATLEASRLTNRADLATRNEGVAFGLIARNPEGKAYGSSTADRRGDNGSNGPRQANLERAGHGSFHPASASRSDSGNMLTGADSVSAYPVNSNTHAAAITAAQAVVATTAGQAGIVGPDEKLVRLFSPIERTTSDVGPRIVDNFYRMKDSEHRILVQAGERYHEIASIVRR
ncbi:hypothetical protein [Pseudoxanthomonas sp. UTMC 1351]|uniref:hypothetical protein n=1 Tax=Pseudoxanthomonas sp. UTMC 1351 TaxID=2695853 RepID=UPI0034CDE6CB